MVNKENILFDLNDLALEPARFTYINSRSEINPFDSIDNMLPLFTAPMLDVINDRNYHIFESNKIRPIIPRSVYIPKDYNGWIAYSLTEIETNLITFKNKKILIDIANGHISRLHKLINILKLNNNEVMIGNIANPETYEMLCDFGVDYIKVGIGNGQVCTTSANGAINYPMGSLIDNINEIKLQRQLKGEFVSKVIADGGMKSFKDIILALALGADFVMLGSILNKALQSAGYTVSNDGQCIDQYDKETIESFNIRSKYTKIYRGMSTKEVQIIISDKNNLRTSEGIKIINNVEYTLEQWVDNFKDYLTSAMSYTNCKTLNDFIGKVNLNLITEQAYNRFNK